MKVNFSQQPFISFIVPVYNTEKYLRTCLDSLKNQVYKNIEIIVINDGSTDESLNIILEYINFDCRFIFINQNNKGLSGARNVGIKKARGEYLIFVDSDDYVSEYLAYEIYNIFHKYPYDLIVYGYDILLNQKKIKSNVMIFKPKEKSIKLMNNFTDSILIQESINLANIACNKAYKASIIKEKSLLFEPNDIIFSEDALFNNCFLMLIETIYVISKNLYFYIVRQDSLTQKKIISYDEKLIRLCVKLISFSQKENLYNKKQGYISSNVIKYLFIILKNIKNQRINNYYIILKKIHKKKELTKIVRNAIFDNKLPIKERSKAFLLYFKLLKIASIIFYLIFAFKKNFMLIE